MRIDAHQHFWNYDQQTFSRSAQEKEKVLGLNAARFYGFL